jgi:hypothetical protein
MSWRVQWSDILVVPPGNRRGSIYSLAKHGSQVVSCFAEEIQGYISVSSAFFLRSLSVFRMILTVSNNYFHKSVRPLVIIVVT